ncbi:hypothetical protein [Pseudooceanicola sp. LIPI14-2-Ac024]|uniref:hypothetical protein n=1 Tax=Pseudooceanicola sp. LIPI14-2-Ac024 TaxID=3344875 RepID=UPI0035CF015A
MAARIGEEVTTDFRSQLRDVTAERHRILDGRMGGIDLSTPCGRATFQEIHDIANARVLAACDGQAAEATDYVRRAAPVTRGAGSDRPAPADRPIHPDAVAYVMLGSQLGLAFLRKSVPEALRTGILAREPEIAAWRSFLARIVATPPEGELRDRILADSTRVFDIFLDATDQILSAHHLRTE